MNYRMITYILGWILLFEAAFLLLPTAAALIYAESAVFGFLWSILICLGVSVLLIAKKPQNTALRSRDGFVIVSLSWIVLSLFGALPFMFTGVCTNYVNALFETVSGFTTTGASILKDVEILPRSVLLWRSFTHWVGGMGVLVFIMAFLPLSGGRNMHMMRAESPGPSVSKLVPRVRTTALLLYSIYFVLTAVMFIACQYRRNGFRTDPGRVLQRLAGLRRRPDGPDGLRGRNLRRYRRRLPDVAVRLKTAPARITATVLTE